MRCPDPDPGKNRDKLPPPGAGTTLLHDLSAWREQLARSIARNNIGMRSVEITLAVHRTLFRLCILAIAEDRHLIIPGYLRQVLDAEDSDRRLAEFFADAGDLWAGPEEYPDIPARHKQSAGKRPVTDDRVVKVIAARLSSADRQYDFSLLSLEEAAGVFDRYIARTIRRSAAHQAIVVDRPDAGAGFVVPTPALLDYAVEQTLAAALAGRSLDEPLPLRILDPSCGAGALLIRAFHGLVPPLQGKQYTIAERTDLLQHTLHGLDPDPHAVAAARMLLAFAACEGEDVRMLPGGFFIVFRDLNRILSGTVQCGNALVGPDIMDDESWAFCPGRERHAIQPFDWQEGFFEILAPGGFDAVISRPPDGPVPAREWWQQYVQRHYAVYDPGATLSAFFFEKSLALLRPRGVLGYVTGDRWLHAKSGAPLRSLLLTRQIEEIVRADPAEKGAKDTGPCFIRLANMPPSHPLVVRPAEPLLTGADNDGGVPAGVLPGFTVDPQALSSGGWALRDTRGERVLEKISRAGAPLETTVLGGIQYGIVIEPESVLVIDASQRKQIIHNDSRCKTLIYPYISGETIGRYAILSPQKYCIFIPSGWTGRHPAAAGHAWRWFRKRYPGIARHLKHHEALLKNRPFRGDYWWECACDPDAWREKKARIIFPARVFPLRFMMAAGRGILNEDTGIIASGSLYLLGILNSRLAGFAFRRYYEETGMAGDSRSGKITGWFPVYTTDFDDPVDAARHDRMVALVTQMLDLHKHMSLAKADQEKRLIQQEIDSTDKQIDSLVYGIYGLTIDEIAVVESALTTIKSPS